MGESNSSRGKVARTPRKTTFTRSVKILFVLFRGPLSCFEQLLSLLEVMGKRKRIRYVTKIHGRNC